MILWKLLKDRFYDIKWNLFIDNTFIICQNAIVII